MATQAQIDSAAEATNSANVAYNAAVSQAQFYQGVANTAAAGNPDNLSDLWVGSINGKEFTKNQYAGYVAYAQQQADQYAASAHAAFVTLKAANDKWKALLAEGVTPEPVAAAPAAADTAEVAVATPVADHGPVTTTDLPDDYKNKLDINAAKTTESLTAATDNPRLGSLPGAATAGAIVGTSSASADDSSKPADNTVIASAFQPLTAKANQLHDYATYTYGLTLFMLTTDEFEALQQSQVDQLAQWNPVNALISSAGRYNKAGNGITPGRNAEFTDDFYFENMRMTTVVGLNAQTRGTNAIELSFTIVEPFGLTLLDRLIKASNGPAINSQNYLAQPYLLELDFFGATDLGDITAPIPKLKKRFPISIIEFKIKASTKGSEYSIKAVPFSHNALKEAMVTTPVNLEVNAETIADFFKDTGSDAAFQQALVDREAVKAASHGETEAAIAQSNIRLARQGGKLNQVVTPNSKYGVNSYADALNEWHTYNLGKNNSAAKDTVSFKFDPIFLDGDSGKIVSETSPKSTVSMTPDAKAAQQGNSSQGDKTASATPASHKFTINAGTTVVDVINTVMRNSNYIKSQLIDVNGSKQIFREDTVVNFYKIVPQIRKLTYDSLLKRYAYDIVYHVTPYDYFNAKHPNLPFAFPNGALKEYNYMYTGKNIDILDFQIEFNVAYYNGVVALPSSADAGNNAANASEKDSIQSQNKLANNPKAIANHSAVNIPQNQQAGASNVNTGTQAFIANALGSIYSNAKGDMIEVKLKILGDPDFIKQDDVYMNPGMPGYEASPSKKMGPDGTIYMDHSDVFCRINFRTPTDLDESTGQMRLDGPYTESKFTGLYKIITVDSEFSKGQFVQTLSAVRMMEANTVNAINADTSDTTDVQANLDAIRKADAASYAEPAARTPDMAETDHLLAMHPIDVPSIPSAITDAATSVRALDNAIASAQTAVQGAVGAVNRFAETTALDAARATGDLLRRTVITGPR